MLLDVGEDYTGMLFTTFYLAFVAVAVFIYYVIEVFLLWEADFARNKLSRANDGCPSNKRMPNVKSFQQNKRLILNAADNHADNFATCELLCALKNSKAPASCKSNEVIREKAKETISLDPQQAQTHGHCGKYKRTRSLLKEERAEELDMDHIFLPFMYFLWAYLFIGPYSMLLWVKGVIILFVRKRLFEWGLISPKPFDAANVLGKLLLEGTLAVHYCALDKETNIAGFFFADFPYVDADSNFQTADIFSIDIDLKTKKMVKAKLDNEVLTASETLTLTFFNTISANHVKLHSLANWGVNLEPEQQKANPFPARNSIVTVMYNYFGFVTFNKFFPLWKKMGLLSENWDSTALTQTFNHGIKDNICQHSNIRDLSRHSKLVNFVIRVRAIFMNEFAKHRECFPGCNGEALFVGTVLHSLDHLMMEVNLVDPLWLDVDCPKFGRMAELGRIVRMGFVPDIPGLYFHKRFKGSGHPFYEAVYRKAARVDKFLADNMDTCIIK